MSRCTGRPGKTGKHCSRTEGPAAPPLACRAPSRPPTFQTRILPCKSAVAEHRAVGRDVDVRNGRLVSPELREVLVCLPPEIVPCEVSRIDAIGTGPKIVQNVLSQLDLMGIERLACSPEARGIVVSVSKSPAVPRRSGAALRPPWFAVSAGDLDFKLPVVPAQPACPRSNAADQSAHQKNDDPQQCGHGGSAPHPDARSLPRRDGPAQDRLASQESPQIIAQHRGRGIRAWPAPCAGI